jgi:hypothetical protein
MCDDQLHAVLKPAPPSTSMMHLITLTARNVLQAHLLQLRLRSAAEQRVLCVVCERHGCSAQVRQSGGAGPVPTRASRPRSVSRRVRDQQLQRAWR